MDALRRTFSTVTLAAPLLLTVTMPAVAHPYPHVDALVIQGSGTISPGLGATPTPQSISFDGTAFVAGTDGGLATYDCSFSGTEPQGALAAGAGAVSGACGLIRLSFCAFIHVGATALLACPELVTHLGVGVVECVFRPHDTLPTTAYDLVCHGDVAMT